VEFLVFYYYNETALPQFYWPNGGINATLDLTQDSFGINIVLSNWTNHDDQGRPKFEINLETTVDALTELGGNYYADTGYLSEGEIDGPLNSLFIEVSELATANHDPINSISNIDQGQCDFYSHTNSINNPHATVYLYYPTIKSADDVVVYQFAVQVGTPSGAGLARLVAIIIVVVVVSAFIVVIALVFIFRKKLNSLPDKFLPSQKKNKTTASATDPENATDDPQKSTDPPLKDEDIPMTPDGEVDVPAYIALRQQRRKELAKAQRKSTKTAPTPSAMDAEDPL